MLYSMSILFGGRVSVNLKFVVDTTSYLVAIPENVSFATATWFGSPLNVLIGSKITERSFLIDLCFLLDMELACLAHPLRYV